MKTILSLISFLIFNISFAQQKDSTKILNEVKVKAYLSEKILISLPATVSIINKNQIENSATQSIIPALNSVAGVKMEERSPGSYRLSIRGSLLRSPFGVRNLKVYYDDFPLTDAGGNTYINLIDQSAIQNIEVLKGPDGSLFGANSGGVVLINTQAKADKISADLLAGSYGLFRENVGFNQSNQNYEFNIHQAYQYANGYRDQSQMKRNFFQATQKVNYNDKGSIKFSGFYSDLGYQTPGGLTLAQKDANPTSARPKTNFTPGAEEQNAGIYNRTLFAGISHEYQFNSNWKHVFSVSGITTDFKNPFITNYEKRKENSLALRTYFNYQKKASEKLNIEWNLGYEFQQSNADILNYNNDKGTATTIIAADRIINQSQFVFTRFVFDIEKKLNAEISSSLNFTNYDFKLLPESTNSSIAGTQKLKPEVMPKLAISYLLNPNFVLRGIVSRGFSAPTTAEVRASDAKINTNLNPEQGWNYELGLRFRTPFERVYIDLAGFYYRLNNAIVRRVNAADQDFYLNAGGTNQKGIELSLNASMLKKPSSVFEQITYNIAVTLNDFKFRDYQIAADNFSGNILTGVPKLNINNNLNFSFKNQISLFIQHQYNGKTSLNDAANVFADLYNLVMMKLGWGKKIGKSTLKFNAGVDNLLNENYSLGNDLNAFGNRFYNPAATRNYFFGLGLRI
ncbi:TonB-dependent receptor [Pedobacter psychrophilus]|uniref:TonB-dependent receptor n=1 Tax=Pedobacter psychrophilus TaxID=1826909 RepID=A0A179DLA8_9SPHI|nr:TonB-dependent receptor [Pedobacter psychrophilus]OAQ41572.1 TonB-dependent receptor [Pedobacter psychrophilus]